MRPKSFRDLPIRRKLVLILMAATGGALLLAGVGLLTLDYYRFRDELVVDLQTLAAVIAQNSTAAVTFKDAHVAQETLAALGAKPQVRGAAVYDQQGDRLVSWARPGSRTEFPSRPGPDGHEFRRGSLRIFEPIVQFGQRIGTVYLEASLDEIWALLPVRILTIASVFLVAALGALALSSRLQGLISKPVVRLADTARAVSERNDYSLRAEKGGSDELGRLIEAFNQMLSQIEERDTALLGAKQDLEQRVADRTLDLQAANSELQQSNRELDDFAYIASHDLKEPLRGIHNYSMFLLEDYGDKLDGDGRAKLETLLRLTRRMEILIDSLLQYSRLGRVDLAIDDVDLNQILAEVMDNIGIPLKAEGAEVRVPRPLPTVRCDRVRVGEIFHNLIVNAVRYNEGPDKGVEVGFQNGLPDAPPVFYVRDNGIGIPAKHHDAIFRIFKRLHGRDRFGGGTGAGLTIVKKIVERHNGTIWVESEPGEGTTFYFTLAKGDSLAEHPQPTDSPRGGQP
ncbi:MAG TPA: ATP-binding protein [Thermoanaerobaculia bacterium]|nr:ATP-binding protein [Thermoanaerobaculia bacterium]